MIINEIKRLITEEEGASLVEYALVIGAGAVLAVILKPILETMLTTVTDAATTQINTAVAP